MKFFTTLKSAVAPLITKESRGLKNSYTRKREGNEQLREVGIKLKGLGDIYLISSKQGGEPPAQSPYIIPLASSPQLYTGQDHHYTNLYTHACALHHHLYIPHYSPTLLERIEKEGGLG